jgi:hypothetical protein
MARTGNSDFVTIIQCPTEPEHLDIYLPNGPDCGAALIQDQDPFLSMPEISRKEKMSINPPRCCSIPHIIKYAILIEGLDKRGKTMNVKKIMATIVFVGTTILGSTSASAWWNDDSRYDRWRGGRWYDDYPGYGYGGYPGYGYRGYPGYGYGGYPSYGYGQPRTIVINPESKNKTPAEHLPR